MKYFQKSAVLFAVAILAMSLCIAEAVAQPGGGRPGGGRRAGGGGRGPGGGGPAALLQREDVQKELELVDDQIKQIEELSQRRREGGRERLEGLQDLSDEERAERFRELRAERQEEILKELDQILLPHQSKRLAELNAQFASRGGSRALTGDRLAEQLGITEEQRENIRKKAEELQEELNEKIAELRQELQDELLKELTPQQRSQYEDLLGEAFEFEQTQRFAGGQFGNRGGQGGNRRAGGGGNRRQGDNRRQRGNRPESE